MGECYDSVTTWKSDRCKNIGVNGGCIRKRELADESWYIQDNIEKRIIHFEHAYLMDGPNNIKRNTVNAFIKNITFSRKRTRKKQTI